MIRVAVSGVDEAICREIALRLRGASIVAGFDISQRHAIPSDCDAVAFVGPKSPTASDIQRIVTAGKQVLLATETSMSVEGIETLVDHARTAGVQVKVMNPDHALPSRQLIRQQLDSSRLGRVGLIRIHRWESSPADRDLDSTKLPAPLIRDMELALWLLDHHPNLVYAVEQRSSEQGTNSVGSIQVHLGCAEGGMALIDYSDGLPTSDGYQSLTMIGSDGAAYADDHQNRQLLYNAGGTRAVPTDEGVLPLVTLVQQFVDDLHSQRELWASVGDWIRTRSLADAVRRSLDLRQAIPVKGPWHV